MVAPAFQITKGIPIILRVPLIGAYEITDFGTDLAIIEQGQCQFFITYAGRAISDATELALLTVATVPDIKTASAARSCRC